MTSVEIWRDLLGFGPTSLPGVAGSCESLAVARRSDCCPVRDVRGSCEFLLSVGLEQLADETCRELRDLPHSQSFLTYSGQETRATSDSCIVPALQNSLPEFQLQDLGSMRLSVLILQAQVLQSALQLRARTVVLGINFKRMETQRSPGKALQPV